MGTKMKVYAAVLVAAVIVYFVVRTPQAESPQGAAIDPPAAELEFVEAAPTPAFELPAPEAAVPRRLVVKAAPGGVAVVEATNVLRVVLEGITEDDAPMTTVTLIGVDERDEWPGSIQDSWPCEGLTSEFDLDPFFASVAEQQVILRIGELELELEVQVDHPLRLLETTRVTLSSGVERSSGQTVYEVRVRLVPAAVIHGRLVREDGSPASEGLVGALRLEEDFPIDDKGHAVVCAADGAFELRVRVSGRYALVSCAEGRRPTTTRVEALVGTRVDVGTLVLESGHTISGHVLCRGQPVAGASIYSRPPTNKTAAAPDAVDSGMHSSVSEWRAFTTPIGSVSLLWLTPTTTFSTLSGTGSRRGGRFELGRQRPSTDENGAFSLGGLGPGEYLLTLEGQADSQSAPGQWDDAPDQMVSVHGGTPGLVVRAPDRGVVLEYQWTSIRFELMGDLESEDEGRLLLRTPTARPTPVDENGTDLRLVADPQAKNFNFTPRHWSAQYPLSGNEPTYVLQAWPNKHMTGEVAFPGRQPVPLDFWTPEPCGEVVVPIQLVRAEEAATLVIELENRRAELPGTFTVKSWRAGQDKDPPDTREVELAEGQLRVEGILPGTYRVRVRPGENRYYSSGLFFGNEFDVELHPGIEVTRSIQLREGAGMRVMVRGDDGQLVSGQYEFFDDEGHPVGLVLGTDLTDGTDGSISSWSFDAYPIHTSLSVYEPGRYRLVLRSPGYAERSVTVELRAGEYEDVDVTLSK